MERDVKFIGWDSGVRPHHRRPLSAIGGDRHARIDAAIPLVD